MRRFTLLIPLALILTGAGADDDQVTKELKKFEGSWTLVSGEHDGKKISDADARRSRINWSGKDVTLITPHQSKTAITATISVIDATKKPAEMDWVRGQGPDAGKTMKAIYEFVDDNQYRICFAPAGKDRPREFSTKEGSGHLLHVWKRFGIDGNEQPTIAVLKLPAGQTMRTATGRSDAARTFAAANRAGHLAVADYANTHNPKLISNDGRTTWALIDMPNPDTKLGTGVMDRIAPALRAAAPAGASVTVTGFEQVQSSGGGGSGPSVLIETAIGAVAALAVLAFVFGSAIAIVPLLIAIPSILTTFLLVLGLTQAISVNFLVEYLVALMGLGIAIDYSLVLITRWREEREAGRPNQEAILAAAPTAGRAVVLSGAIVAVGLL